MRKRTTKLIEAVDVDFETMVAEKEQIFSTACDTFENQGQLTNESEINAVLPSMCQVKFFKDSCPESSTLHDFVHTCVSKLQYEHIPKGEAVFHLGDQGDKFYIVLSGRVGIFVPRDLSKIEEDEGNIEKQLQKRGSRIVYESIEEQIRNIIMKSQKPQNIKEAEIQLLHCGKLDQYFTQKLACRYQKVATLFAGLSFGEMALTTDKPRGASIIALTDLKMVSLSKTNYKKVFEKQIQALNSKIDYFLKIFPQVTRFNMSKLVVYFKEGIIPQNSYLWKQGDPVTNFILIYSGQVQLEKDIYSYNELNASQKYLVQAQKPQKQKIIVSTLQQGSFVGDEEVLQRMEKRPYSCKTLEITKYYTMSADEFHLIKKTYPEVLKIMMSRYENTSKWVQERITKINEVKNQQYFSKPVDQQNEYVERRRVEELEAEYMLKIGQLSHRDLNTHQRQAKATSTIRSVDLIKHTKKDLVEQNEELFSVLKQNSENKGIDQEFNMLKMANANIQKSLKIRVQKQYENFQPPKPKAQTPYFSSADRDGLKLLDLIRSKSTGKKYESSRNFITSLFTIPDREEMNNSPDLYSGSQNFNINRILNPKIKEKTKQLALQRSCKTLTNFSKSGNDIQSQQSINIDPVIQNAAQVVQPIHSNLGTTQYKKPRKLKSLMVHTNKSIEGQEKFFVFNKPHAITEFSGK